MPFLSNCPLATVSPRSYGHLTQNTGHKPVFRKNVRRLLRVVAKGEEVTQDVSTLENPAILEQLSKPL